MRHTVSRLLLVTVVLLWIANISRAQEPRSAPSDSVGSVAMTREAGTGNSTADDTKKKPAPAAEPSTGAAPGAEIADPLVRVLIAKGLISNEEARALAAGRTPGEQRDRLATLLRDKGLLTSAEFEAVRTASPTTTAGETPAFTGNLRAGAEAQNTQNQQPQSPGAQPKPAAPPSVIAAVAPIRVLQVDPPKREGLIPDIKLGSGARLKPYGFFKASLIHDSSSPGGNDFPLPLFLGDTGPNASPEFHIKVRALRLGTNFEWLDPAPNTVITGRLEFDFEGDFTRANNRNISSIRSSQPSLRLAWGRIDHAMSERLTGFALFGQDWTPFGSSTVPNTIETTAFHLGYGNIYERAPQFRFGFNYNAGGKRSLKFQPEFALVLPAFGNTPANVADQLGFGERQGPDSQRPEIQGRFVTQFQLDKSPGVVPAQLIVSFTQGSRRAIVTAAGVPAAFRAAFPTGAEVDSSRYGYSGEIQLPTHFVTVIGKYYNGEDLRFYFGGQLLSTFNDTAGLTGTATAASIDGSSTVVFGLRNGVPVVAPQRPVRGQGGFINLGFPLSRIFDADPKGRNAGWTGYLHYGYDQATARDARRFGGRAKSDVFMSSLQYKLNAFVTFALEESLFRTRAANSSSFSQGGLPLFRGIPSRETHDVRSEFATIFTF
ncbi:MAG: DcaP outer membrane protein [Acidobacteriota bacterium]|nr:DcaP outer membrane protein [Acidobacteriota bacterium]